MRLALLLALAAACSKPHPECDHLTEMAMKCDKELDASKGEERAQAKQLLAGMCREAFRNDTSSVEGSAKALVVEMYEGMRKEAQCTEKANTCAEYEACVPKSKYDAK